MMVIGLAPDYHPTMSRTDNVSVSAVESWKSQAFSVSGICFAVFAGLWGAFALGAMESRVLQDTVGPIGWTAAFVGLLGVARELDGVWSRRVAGAFASLGLVGASVTAVGNLLELTGVVDTLPAFVDALQGLLLAGIVLGFLAVAVGVVRASGSSRRLALLLAAPPIVFLVNVVRVASLGSTTPTWGPFVLATCQAIALLGIGYVLRAGAEPAAALEQGATQTTE